MAAFRSISLWLIEHTTLTSQQIGAFCHMHHLEVENLRRQKTRDCVPLNPILSQDLSQEDITQCELDSLKSLPRKVSSAQKILEDIDAIKAPKYTPLAKRQNRPDGIAWIVRNYPHMSDTLICKLLSTTANTVQAIRQKTHRLSSSIKPRDPVFLGLCSRQALEQAVTKMEHTLKIEKTSDISF